MALVLEHPHRLGPDEVPVWDQPVWIMESYGANVDPPEFVEIVQRPPHVANAVVGHHVADANLGD